LAEQIFPEANISLIPIWVLVSVYWVELSLSFWSSEHPRPTWQLVVRIRVIE